MTARAFTPRRLATAALVLHAALVGVGVVHDSVTNDELGHLPAGIAYLQRGAFAVNPQPPLVKLLGAAAALAAGARPDYEHAWREAGGRDQAVDYPAFSRDFMRANAGPPGHYQHIYVAARLVVLPFSLLLGVVLFVWGRELFGEWGGLLACTLWCFSPDAIAHAALFTSDVPAAATMFTATWAFWRWLRAPRMAAAIGCGVLLGLAQLVKLSALSLYGLWPLMALPSLIGTRRLASLRAVAPGAVALVATSLLVLNAGYGFQGTGDRLGEPDYLSTTFTRTRPRPVEIETRHVYRSVYAMRVNRFRGSPLGRMPVPLPRAFLAAVDLQGFEARPGIPGTGFFAAMRGEVRLGSWALYFPYALWAKSTPAFVALLLAAPILMLLVPRARLAGRNEAFVWIPPVALIASSTVAGLDLGVRYVLPAVPFLMLGTARTVALLPSRGSAVPHARAAAAVLGLAALVHVASAIAIGPHALAYFSPLVGGPSVGHRQLAESNLDWGQELRHLRRWLDARGIEGPVPAALYTNVDPAIYGLETTLVPRDRRALVSAGLAREPDEPRCLEPGLYVVSANFLAGLPFRLAPADRVIPVPVDAYRYFDRLEPSALVGYALHVYELDDEQAATLNRQLAFRCTPPRPGSGPGAP